MLEQFLYNQFLTSRFLKYEEKGPNKNNPSGIEFASSYSPAEVSDPSEVPRFVRELFFNAGKEVKLVACAR